MVKILKRIRYHDIALKATVLNNDEKKVQVKHARKNLIDIDSDSSSDKSGFTETSFDATRGRTFDHTIVNGLTKQVVKRDCKSKLGISVAASENFKTSGVVPSSPVNKVY
jgi:hypothetical protein